MVVGQLHNWYVGPDGSFGAQGWLASTDNPASWIGYRFRIDGVLVALDYPIPGYGNGWAGTNYRRPDIASIYPQYTGNQGFDTTNNLSVDHPFSGPGIPTSGVHTVCLEGLEVTIWQNVECRTRNLDRVSATPMPAASYTTAPDRSTGIFVAYDAPTSQFMQFCSGAVVNSSSGNVVQSAAHCFYNNGAFIPRTGIYFAPGWRATSPQAPYGWFLVDYTVVSGLYISNEDQTYDIAYVHTTTNVQSVVGGLNNAFDGSYPASGMQSGYPFESPSIIGNVLAPTTKKSCTNQMELTQYFTWDDDAVPAYSRWSAPTMLEANCMNLEGGSSGGPWQNGTTTFAVTSAGENDRSGHSANNYGPLLGANALAVFNLANY